MTKFVKRTTAPTKDNKYYNSNINPFVSAGYGIFQNNGNCTAYAYARFYETTGSKPKLSTGNAENWYGKTSDGYKRGQIPKIGAIVCWKKGKAGDSSDGAGHVAFVEEVKSNGDIVVSESAWKKYIFRTKTYKKADNYETGLSGTYKFQGFIYSPIVFETESTNKTTTKYVYNCESLNIRKGAGTSYSAVNDLTKGTKVTVYEIKNGWARIGTNQWVSNNYLTTAKSSKVYSTKQVTNATGGLNVRTSNSYSGTKNIAKEKTPLPNGTLVSVIKTSGNGVQIGANRWVYKSYLK